MKQIRSADFRKAYPSLSEPHQVTAYGEVIATYYPIGTEAEVPVEATPVPEEAPVAETRMTIRPVKASKRPPLVRTEQRVIDPIEKGRHEREVWRQLSSRMNSKNDSRRR